MSLTAFSSVGVIGSGAWGTALALVAGRAGRTVALWGRDEVTLAEIAAHATNSKYLADLVLDPAPKVAATLADVMAADIVLLAVPAQQLRVVLQQIAPYVRPQQPLVICAKGVEQGTGLLMPEVMAEVLPKAAAAMLSGPNIASEIAKGLPAATTIAAGDERMARSLCAALSSRTFRCYPSTDLTGVALAGAMKNVLTMAAGIVIGQGLGENARAALLSRGIAEMMRLSEAMGGQAETMMGLSGVGDLSLTSTRNYSLGVALGQGKSLRELVGQGGKLAEGVATAEAVMLRAHKHNIEIPICEAVAAVLGEKLPLAEAIASLLARPMRHERG